MDILAGSIIAQPTTTHVARPTTTHVAGPTTIHVAGSTTIHVAGSHNTVIVAIQPIADHDSKNEKRPWSFSSR